MQRVCLAVSFELCLAEVLEFWIVWSLDSRGGPRLDALFVPEQQLLQM